MFFVTPNLPPKPFGVPLVVLRDTGKTKGHGTYSKTHFYDNRRRNVEYLKMNAFLIWPRGIDLCAHPLQILQSFLCARSTGGFWFSRSCIQFSSNNIDRQAKESGLRLWPWGPRYRSPTCKGLAGLEATICSVCLKCWMGSCVGAALKHWLAPHRARRAEVITTVGIERKGIVVLRQLRRTSVFTINHFDGS